MIGKKRRLKVSLKMIKNNNRRKLLTKSSLQRKKTKNQSLGRFLEDW